MEADGGGLESEVQANHIKKRSLKNKALSVTFNEKALTDFVCGFHKRKKKRRKEAQNQQQEALRRKRIELRKKRKEERAYVIGGPPPAPDAEPNENDEVEEETEEDEDDDKQKTSFSGTKVYANGSVKVIVTTSEISREDDALDVRQRDDEVPKSNSGPEKKQNLPVLKKAFKKVEKKRSRPKTLTKRDKRMGKKVERRR